MGSLKNNSMIRLHCTWQNTSILNKNNLLQIISKENYSCAKNLPGLRMTEDHRKQKN